MSKITIRQIELLIDFMEGHSDLAVGRIRSKEGRATANNLWKNISQILNAEAFGAAKTPKEWNKFYNDYKCRVKSKLRKIAQSQQQTGGGTSEVVPLTTLEERLSAIIAPDNFQTLPVRHNPLDVVLPCTSNFNSDKMPEVIEYIVEQPASNNLENIDPLDNIDIVEEEPVLLQDIIKPVLTKKPKLEKKKRKAPSEIQMTRETLSEIENKRLQTNRDLVEAQLARNLIEKEKVDAIRFHGEQMQSLVKAAWALVDKFKTAEVKNNIDS